MTRKVSAFESNCFCLIVICLVSLDVLVCRDVNTFSLCYEGSEEAAE